VQPRKWSVGLPFRQFRPVILTGRLEAAIFLVPPSFRLEFGAPNRADSCHFDSPGGAA
jgi:hypothetical protein